MAISSSVEESMTCMEINVHVLYSGIGLPDFAKKNFKAGTGDLYQKSISIYIIFFNIVLCYTLFEGR